MCNNMKGKTLVISGGTKGIGKECVYKFASKGINVEFINGIAAFNEEPVIVLNIEKIFSEEEIKMFTTFE